MPIKPENRDRYPANWKTEIRPAILKRAGDRCEWCHKPNRETVRSIKVDGEWFWIDAEGWHVDSCGRRSFRAFHGATDDESEARVVLTIAHLDHTPENCDPANLRALCQRCHNRYDAPHRAKNRRRKNG